MAKLDKLNIDKQIEHIKSKGITFGKVEPFISEEKAKIILTERNTYFRIKSYAKNFSKNSKNLYENVDFSHLQELATLDFYFRNLILKMVYSVEHFMKIKLLADYSEHTTDINGCDIIFKYLKAEQKRENKKSKDLKHRNYVNKNLKNKLTKHIALGQSGYLRGLIAEYTDVENIKIEHIPIWAFIELVSFGEFLKLSNYFYRQVYANKINQDFSYYLRYTKRIRNAVSHNNCLLNTIKDGYKSTNIKYNKDILGIYLSKIDKNDDKNIFQSFFIDNMVFHDFFVSLYIFSKISSPSILKDFYAEDAKKFISNIDERLEIYKDNEAIHKYLVICKNLLEHNLFM